MAQKTVASLARQCELLTRMTIWRAGLVTPEYDCYYFPNVPEIRHRYVSGGCDISVAANSTSGDVFPPCTVVVSPSKTVKKHKQRQGFHTEAAVSAWEGGHAHDLGACKCDGGVAALSAPDRHHSPIGALHNLPWGK